MKGYIAIACIMLTACSSTKKWEQQAEEQKNLSPYQQEVVSYQDSMSVALISGSNGVLAKKDLASAKPLSFFPPNEDFRFNARFERILDGEEFEMQTSTDRLPIYRDFGILHFDLRGEAYSLHLYQSLDHPDYLFCPFKDLTNGTESYGAGRYLDFQMKDTLNPVLDFNYSYNPYCAYNYKYSCPIPPQENHLNLRVEAGVKTWK